MSEFVAGAFVDVKPDAKGFRTDLQRQINNQIKTAIKIPVEVDPKRFKSTVNSAAKSTQAKVPIVPSTTVTELRTQIQNKINSATKGLKIKVPIEVEQTGAGSRGGRAAAAAGGTGGGGKAAAVSAVASTKALTDAEKQQIVVDNALKRSKEQLAISSKAFDDASRGNITAEERLLRLRESRTASTRAARAANDVLAVSADNLTNSQKRSLENAALEATQTRATVADKIKEASATAAAAELQSKATKSRAKAVEIMGIEVKEVKTLSELKSVENKLTSTEAALTRQASVAHEQNVLGIEAENTAMLQQLELQKDNIVAQRAALKGETARARQNKTAARGAGATLLSLLGVRGATLAASSAFLAGAVAAAVFVKGLSAFAKLETELNVFQATTGATAEQMKQISKVAQDLGRDITLPGVSASDAAVAMSALARAGLSVSDSMAGAKGVLQLATAAQISQADAADLTAGALNAFGLSGEKAVHVADLLANAANSSQGSIAEMGAAMAQASAIARQVGFSLDNTLAILTQFARNGLKGSDAGTSLRTALSRLIAPTKKASDLIDALGLNLRDAQGRLRPDVFVQFGEATKNLTPELRDMIAATIGGQDAIRAFSIGAREGARGLKIAQLQMAATGSAAQLAAARTKGLAGGFGALASNTETLGISLGRVAAGPMNAFVVGLNQIVTDLGLLTSGETGQFFDNLKSEFADMGKGARDTAVDVNKFFQGIANQDTGKIREALGGIFGKQALLSPRDAGKTKSDLISLQEELTNLQNARVNAFKAGLDIEPFTAKIKAVQAQLRQAKIDAGEIIPVTKLEKQLAPLQELYDQLELVRASLAARGEKTTFIDQAISDVLVKMNTLNIKAVERAKKVKKDIANGFKGTEIAKTFEAEFKLIAGNIDLATPEVLSGLQKLGTRIKNATPITGADSAELGKRIVKSLRDAINAAVEADDPDTAAALKKRAIELAALFGVEWANAIKNVKVPLTADELANALLPSQIKAARAEAFGTVAQQIATKQGELAVLQKQLGDVVKGSADEKDVLDKIAAKKAEIRGLREQQAQAEKDANQKSAKKITDTISAEEQRLLNKLTLAQADESLKNDLRAQIALRNFYTRQIAVAKATIRDAETQRETVNALTQKLFDINNDIVETRIGRLKQLAKPIDDAAERASETETLKDDVKQASRRVVFWKRQVQVLKDLVKQRKATVAELKAAQAELNTAQDEFARLQKSFREQKRERQQQGLELDISFFQTTGNVSAEISARRRFIAFLEGQKKFFKGNVIKLKEIRNAIAEQNKAIKDLLGESEKGGTTLADLFTQQVGITNQAGVDLPAQIPGNVTQPIEDEVTKRLRARAAAANLATTVRNQATGTIAKKPLITVDDVLDPAIFTALQRLGIQVKTIPQAKTSTTGPAALVDTPAQQIDKSTTRQVQSNNELIAALNRLTQAVSGRAVATGGNRTSPTGETPASIAAARYNAMARFWRAHKNRNMHEETAGA